MPFSLSSPDGDTPVEEGLYYLNLETKDGIVTHGWFVLGNMLASTTPLGKLFTDPTALQDPIASAVQSLSSTKQSTAYSKFQEAQKNAETTYQKLVALTPNDATVQIQLGQAAQSAGDSKTAIAAYQKFLKLAPTDPLAPQVKQALKALQTTPAVSSTTTGR